ncbi:MAG: beta-lactamase family protein, partial [Candidatus Hydrogenedentes bacterium]|nr:beta-lactamase family protein [Candidatus Hydrogenedentota bacterium]
VTPENLPPITFAQLAEHTAGLPRLPGNIAPTDPHNPYADYSVENMYAWLATGKVDRTPGEESVYSNFGVGLLGHLLALKQGSSYEELARQRLLRPLSMDHTAIALSEEQKARLALPHERKDKVASNWDIPTLAGAGGWRSTLPDMTAFLRAAMGDAPSPLDRAFALAVKPRFKVQDGVQIGLSWMITDSSLAGRPPLVWHNGQTGGYASFLGFRQDGSLGIVLLCNTASDAVDQAAVDIMRDIAAMGD